MLALDDSIPNGTYIDMCENLPVNDPAKITVPTIIMRGQYDGIAAFADIVEFFVQLPNADKELAVMPDIAHGSFTQSHSASGVAGSRIRSRRVAGAGAAPSRARSARRRTPA